MVLRSFNIKGRPIVFTFDDGPIEIGENLIALTDKEFSDLLRLDLTVRGDENLKVFEGDKVFVNDECVGYVIYSKGFKLLQKETGEVKEIVFDEQIQVRVGDENSTQVVKECPLRTELKWRYDDFNLKGYKTIVTKTGSMIVLNGRNFDYKYIRPAEIQFYTGIDEYFFGDFAQGGWVVLHDGLPNIKIGDKYVRLHEETV